VTTNNLVDLAASIARKRTSSRPWIDPMKGELRLRKQFADIAGKPAVSPEKLAQLRTDTDKINYVMSVVGNE
jgi:hypothetical protein